jgi:hypothetical protein
VRTSAVVAGLLWVLTVVCLSYFWFESEAFSECLKTGCSYAYLNIIPLYLAGLTGLGAIIATTIALTRKFPSRLGKPENQ